MKKLPFLLLALWAGVACYCQSSPSAKKPSEIHLTGKNEPGKAFTLDITVLDINTGQPVPGIEIFVYHTNNKGDYERDASNVARIHGTVYSNQQGKVRLYTIYPRGYNDSPRGAHIHFVVNGSENAGLMFDDYTEKKYDRKNLKTLVVYLDDLQENDSGFVGKATMYVKKG